MAAAVLISRCHARRAAVAQTSPACAYCRRRPRRYHILATFKKAINLGKKAGPRSSCRSPAALTAASAAATASRLAYRRRPTPQLRQLGRERSSPCAAPRRASVDLVAERWTQQYVRNGGEADARGLRLNDVDDPEETFTAHRSAANLSCEGETRHPVGSKVLPVRATKISDLRSVGTEDGAIADEIGMSVKMIFRYLQFADEAASARASRDRRERKMAEFENSKAV